MKFLGRWGDYLRTGRHESAPARSPLIQCSIQDDRPTVGLYTPSNSRPVAGRYLLTVAMEALAHGRQVHLVTPAPYSRVRLTALANVRPGPRRTLPDAAGRSGATGPFDEWIALSNQLVPRSARWGCATLCCASSRSGRVSSNGGHAYWLAEYQQIAVYSPFTADAVRARLAEANVAPLPITVLTPPVRPRRRPDSPRKRPALCPSEILQWRSPKRQDLQIEAFRHLVESGRADGVLPPRRVVGDPSHPSPIPHRLHRCGPKAWLCSSMWMRHCPRSRSCMPPAPSTGTQWTRRRPHRRTRAVRVYFGDCPIGSHGPWDHSGCRQQRRTGRHGPRRHRWLPL